MEESKKTVQSEQEVNTETIIPVLKNGQIEFDEPQRGKKSAFLFFFFPFVSFLHFLLTLLFFFLPSF